MTAQKKRGATTTQPKKGVIELDSSAQMLLYIFVGLSLVFAFVCFWRYWWT